MGLNKVLNAEIPMGVGILLGFVIIKVAFCLFRSGYVSQKNIEITCVRWFEMSVFMYTLPHTLNCCRS